MGWQTSVNDKWPVATPAELGQFRAAALTYRLGLVPEAPPAATITANLADMFALKGNAYSLPHVGDGNRESEGADTAARAVSPLYHAVGPVVLRITDKEPTGLSTVNLADYHDPVAKRIRGGSGVIDWRYGDGLYLLTAPASQAAGGYLGVAGPVDLPDLRVTIANEFAVVWAVALDTLPLSVSRKILLQVMTEQRNSGFETEGFPVRKIVNIGSPPLLVRSPRGTISFKRPDAARLRVTPLDRDGAPLSGASAVTGAASLELRPDTLLYLVEP